MKEIVYRRCGDYYIPDLMLPEQEVLPLGKYGRMRMKYLKEHSPYLYNNHLYYMLVVCIIGMSDMATMV